MRIVITGVEPVGIHGAEILNLKLDQGFCKFCGVSKLDGEGICELPVSLGSWSQGWNSRLTGFKLKFSAQNVHEELDHGVHGG